MSNSFSPKTSQPLCPSCGALLTGNNVAGLCARCLMALNFTTDTLEVGVSTEPVSHQHLPPFSPEELSADFPQLDIIELLGRGGMGVVYKARQRSLGRLVALKLLARERANDPQFAQRFAQEAQALAALSHPNIVTIYDFGRAGGFYYLLMEYVDGVNLRQAITAGKLNPEQALVIVPAVCEALQYAHAHQIVHRDIKPENLLLDKEGRVKIADFGVAKMLGAESLADFTESQPAGTPQYMAPEQKLRLRTDHRADIYSLGVVLYEMLTGELPTADFQPPSKHVQVDVRIDEVVLRALESKPDLRYSTAIEFRDQLLSASCCTTKDFPSTSSPKPLTPQDKRRESLFRKYSIVGACWSAVSFVAFFMALICVVQVRRGSISPLPHGLQPVQLMVLIPSVVFAAIGPIIATVFGWLAVKQIRASQGKLRGLPAALLGTVVFPLSHLLNEYLVTAILLALSAASAAYATMAYQIAQAAAALPSALGGFDERHFWIPVVVSTISLLAAVIAALKS